MGNTVKYRYVSQYIKRRQNLFTINTNMIPKIYSREWEKNSQPRNLLECCQIKHTRYLTFRVPAIYWYRNKFSCVVPYFSTVTRLKIWNLPLLKYFSCNITEIFFWLFFSYIIDGYIYPIPLLVTKSPSVLRLAWRPLTTALRAPLVSHETRFGTASLECSI